MTFENKLKKIIAIDNEKLKKLKLISFSLKLVPGSNQQKKVKNLI